MERRIVGVLGGMGPLATVDFMRKVIAVTPAERDQDHVPLVVYSVPQVPDRTTAIATGSDDPFPALLAGLRALEQAGAELIVMPCNTAHAWFDRLAASTDLTLMHIAEAVRTSLDRQPDGDRRIALMATAGTVRTGIYQRALASRTRTVVTPPPTVQDAIGGAIAAVKAGDIDRAHKLAESAAEVLCHEGAETLLLACTELPIALAGTRFEAMACDATHCLAEACVAFSCGWDARDREAA
jgi:aspartate racemase